MTQETAQAAKGTALVIDDELPTLKMFSLLLSAYGYDALTAENGVDGVELFTAKRPSVVLTDIKMPGMDGIEVLQAIKKVDPRAEVIVVTGHGDMDLAIQALNLDATDFIHKPLQRDALEKALTRAEERLHIADRREGQISLEERPAAAVVSVRGAVTADALPQLSDTFDQAVAMGKPVVLVDFDDNVSINGAGLTGITDLLQKHRDLPARIVLAGLSANFKTVFDMVGITRLAQLFDNEDEALRSQ